MNDIEKQVRLMDEYARYFRNGPNAEITTLHARIAALTEALEFYADPANWTSAEQVNIQELFDTAMGADLGTIARAALKGDAE